MGFDFLLRQLRNLKLPIHFGMVSPRKALTFNRIIETFNRMIKENWLINCEGLDKSSIFKFLIWMRLKIECPHD